MFLVSFSCVSLLALYSLLNENDVLTFRFQLDTVFVHTPDKATPVEETMDTIQELYLEGKFRRVSLNLYHIGGLPVYLKFIYASDSWDSQTSWLGTSKQSTSTPVAEVTSSPQSSKGTTTQSPDTWKRICSLPCAASTCLSTHTVPWRVDFWSTTLHISSEGTRGGLTKMDQ